MEKKSTRIFKILSVLFCFIVIAYKDSSTSAKIVQAAEVAINEANFPDENFRDYVLNYCDTDKNEVLSEREIKNTTQILINGKEIIDLKGIENFTSLTKLSCSFNQLSNLDVSQNPNLKKLDCSNNQLLSINVGQNSSLTELNCGWNRLESLDVSKNPSLVKLYCDLNQLESLDVSQDPSLMELRCDSNQLNNLDVSQNPSLMELRCDSNQLYNLDVSKNPNLMKLSCSTNQLDNLDVSKNLNLMELDCSYSFLISLDISQNPNLTKLICSANQLNSLDVSQSPNLTQLDCSWNELTSIKLNKQTYNKLLLTKGSLHDYYITLFNISNATETANEEIIVTDINKPATYQYEYHGKKIDFTILYVDSDENSEKTSKISYVLNGGMNAAENPSTYIEGIGVGSFASATKIDTIFDGWYLDAAFTQKVTSIEANQTGDITLYAKFITSVLNNVVTSSCTRFFYDYEYKNSVSGTAITLYGNCKKNTDTIKKDVILYTDILASYQYILGGNGKVKASTGKVIAGITMSDTKPALNRGKIIDNTAAKIAKAKIKHGQITITSVGKMAGTVYLWVMDTGKKEVAECYPIQVKLAPKKLEVQDLSGKKASKLRIENGSSVNVQVVGFIGSIKTTDCEYVPTVDSRSESYVSIEKVAYSDADGNFINNVFSIKGIGLKNKKDTKVSITFTCKENGKKIKFTTTITKTAVK